MNWIDESRRKGFESLGTSKGANQRPGELDNALPDEVKCRSIAIGNELILGYDDALAAIAVATQHSIAVLGFDSGEVLGSAFQVLGCSGYDDNITGNEGWEGYVARMNSNAERWIKEHQLGRNHGYILTSTSLEEFRALDCGKNMELGTE